MRNDDQRVASGCNSQLRKLANLACITNIFSGDSTCNFEGIYSLTYSVGLAVIEVLSTISGPDSIMMVWNLGKYGFSFEEAFESVYGISWDEAVPVLAEAISKYSY